MEPYAIITPTRDRPKMLEFCKYQVSQFTIKPEKHYIIDYAPVSDDVDISERIFAGVQKAKADGIDLVFIGENDDYLPPDYISSFGETKGVDFFGSEETIYYNIRNRTWQKFYHPNRSSLFTTGFRVSAVSKFIWPKNTPFVDIELWKYAKPFKRKFVSLKAIGVKSHGEGPSGGSGHRMVFNNKDPQLKWLQSNVTEEAYEFYCKLPL